MLQLDHDGRTTVPAEFMRPRHGGTAILGHRVHAAVGEDDVLDPWVDEQVAMLDAARAVAADGLALLQGRDVVDNEPDVAAVTVALVCPPLVSCGGHGPVEVLRSEWHYSTGRWLVILTVF